MEAQSENSATDEPETNLPVSLQPHFETAQLNAPIVLHKGSMTLTRGDGESTSAEGTLTWAWSPTPKVRLEAECSRHTSLFDVDGVVVAFEGAEPARVMVTQAELLGGHVEGSVVGSLTVGGNPEICSLDFHLPNFHDYIGSAIGEVTSEWRRYRAGRLVLKAAGWTVTVDNLHETAKLAKAAKREGGYAITHAGRIARSDGATFRPSEVSDLVESLAFFFAFVRGFWTQPFLLVGLDDTGRHLYLRADPVRISPWAGGLEWFSPHSAQDLPPLFEHFSDLWANTDLRGPLKSAVNFYLEANATPVTLEKSLVMAQAGLELLSAVRFESSSGPARQLVQDTGLDLAVPRTLPALARAAANELKRQAKGNPLDGPGALYELRNFVVHPVAANRARLNLVSHEATIEAWQLALRYFELGLLRWIGYKGRHLDRTQPGWLDEGGLVPWVQ